LDIVSEDIIARRTNGFNLCPRGGSGEKRGQNFSSQLSEIYESVEVAFSKPENKISSWSGVLNFEIMGYISSDLTEIVPFWGYSERFLYGEMAEKGDFNKNDILKRFMAFPLSANGITCVRGRK